MKNQANMKPPKEAIKASVTDPKEMKIYKFPEKEFKIIILKKFNEIQENTDQLNKIRKAMQK